MHNRRNFIKGLGAGAAALLLDLPSAGGEQTAMSTPAQSASSNSPAGPFKLRGIYFHDGFDAEPASHAPLNWTEDQWTRQLRWLVANDINLIEFATMLEFSRVPSTQMERDKIAGRLKILDLAHGEGVKFSYLLSNTVLSTVPENEPPGGQLGDRAKVLCPQVPENFDRTIALQKWYMDTYREADYFEEFAGDWGGCSCGKCGVPDYMRYVAALAGHMKEINPSARMFANTWSITSWGPPLETGNWRAFFDVELPKTREVIAALPSMPREVNLGLPCHHLYRPLVFTAYGGAAGTPRFPVAADLQSLYDDGREVLAWPHFVMDDDAYRPAAWGIVHSELRYIRQVLQRLRDAGIVNVQGNLYLPWLQISNTFGYGRLLKNPDAEIRPIIDDFARVVAHAEDAAQLAEVLAWVENNSYWQQQVPEQDRLPNLPCDLDKPRALALAAKVRPNPSPTMPLPYAAQDWLADLRRSIARMDWA